MPRQSPTLLYLIKQVELSVRDRLDDVVRPEGITTVQYTALTVLEAQPDLTAAQLARRSFVTAQSTSDLVAALLDRGLVDRHRDPDDRRRLVLTLTPSGRQLLGRLRARVAAIEKLITAELTPSAARELHRGLDAARAALARGSSTDNS